ncbi:helix-turn-helix domain-containing protein (plasmid) [Pseudarthrobacter sp. P1]|uniref:helix-turn-helix domain-containing protein n=1 Tax=Pseudarthrobacter sp. P1 TaxID=3418418 RepID=UPI003CF9A336
MPKILRARAAADAAEERTVRKLAGARHAPADWNQRGRIVALSWSGLRVPAIARELGCHEQTVRRWLVRFNASGLDGLADLGGQGRLRRITEAARAQGIDIHRSQVRRILRQEGVRWRRTRSWIRSKDPDFAGKGRGSSSSTRTRPGVRRSSASTNSVR